MPYTLCRARLRYAGIRLIAKIMYAEKQIKPLPETGIMPFTTCFPRCRNPFYTPYSARSMSSCCMSLFRVTKYALYPEMRTMRFLYCSG